MKPSDQQILAHLRHNARMTLTKMSRKTGIPVSTIFERIKCQEKELITKHTALVDFFKLGYTTRANIAIKVDKKIRAEISSYLQKHMSVNSVYKITNGYDYLIEGVFRDLLELEEFTEELEEKFRIRQKNVYFIIEDIKREGFMSDPVLQPA